MQWNLKRKNVRDVARLMERGSVIKRLEIRTDDSCKTCHTAIDELVPLANQHKIPVVISNPLETDEFIPVVCFIEDVDGYQKKTCFEGYSDDTRKLFDMFVKS